MTRDALNLQLMTGVYSGRYDFPNLSASKIELADTMIPFNKAKLLYGTPIDFDFGSINVIHYSNEVLERRSSYGR